MCEEEDEVWVDLTLFEPVLEKIDSWRKTQHPTIEDRATAIAKLIEISQPDDCWLTDYEDVFVTLAGPTLTKVEKYKKDMVVRYEAACRSLAHAGAPAGEGA
jgi:hypothetical protein